MIKPIVLPTHSIKNVNVFFTSLLLFPVENGMTPDFNELQSPLQRDNSISSTNIYILYG